MAKGEEQSYYKKEKGGHGETQEQATLVECCDEESKSQGTCIWERRDCIGEGGILNDKNILIFHIHHTMINQKQ